MFLLAFRSNLLLLLEASRHRRTLSRLYAADAQKDVAIRAKESFLSSMSHEMRTPLHGVMAAVSLLDANGVSARTPDEQAVIRIIQTSADVLLQHINQILDYSKAAAKKIVLNRAPLNPTEVFLNAGTVVATLAASKGIRISREFASDVPTLVVGDAQRLGQVQINLLGNALKFTPVCGEVTLRVRTLPPSGTRESHAVEFSVIDTGLGLETAGKEELFQPFQQAELDTSRRFGGTGLGLALCKDFVKLWGGEIGCDSKGLGCGSHFWFTLPMTPQLDTIPSSPFLAVSPAQASTPPRVLVFSLSQTLRADLASSVQECLRNCWGMDPYSASVKVLQPTDEDQAVALIQKDSDSLVCLIDVLGPPTTGSCGVDFDATRPQDAAWWSHSRPVELACTAEGVPYACVSVPTVHASGSSSRDSSGTKTLFLPLSNAEVDRSLVALSNLLGQSSCRCERTLQATAPEPVGRRGSRSEPTLPAEAATKKVLLVDDNITNRKVGQMLVRRAGYECVVCAGGLEAVALVSESPSEYGLVLMDLHMPEVDGVHAAARIKELTPSLPILCMTADKLVDGQFEGVFDGFCPKPVTLPTLKELILKSW
eukprot:CAMPEP_0114541912 /NCGR_PEP_ID=MMETSP0114-20121206/1557_1 /TAXON_ID=31324 /ORGANISM="Goniomonas sp, Strain m" /LENGTH=596 /DNA_ID=CAMNT_0001726179 /DNA_START=800 /DNA_END=2590 /DNA_ORIENTATION=-